jgi:hypothetical protein
VDDIHLALPGSQLGKLVSNGGVLLLGGDLVAHDHRWRGVPDPAHQLLGSRARLRCQCFADMAQVVHMHIGLAHIDEPVLNGLGERGLGQPFAARCGGTVTSRMPASVLAGPTTSFLSTTVAARLRFA